MQTEPTIKRSHRSRDYLLYFAISFAVVAVMIFVGLSHGDHDKFMKWAFFFVDIVVVFGLVIEENRTLWRSNSFWLITGSLLLLHCIAVAAIFARVQHPKGAWLVGAVPLEIAFLLNFIRWLLRPTPSPQ